MADEQQTVTSRPEAGKAVRYVTQNGEAVQGVLKALNGQSADIEAGGIIYTLVPYSPHGDLHSWDYSQEKPTA